MERSYIYVIQILIIAGISIGTQSLDFNNRQKWALTVARYVTYILTMHASEVASVLIYEILNKKRALNTQLLSKVNVNQVMMYTTSIAALLYNRQTPYAEDFLLICLAYFIVKYPELVTLGKKSVSMGVSLAASYVEGYLAYIMPPANQGLKTFEDKMRAFESVHDIVIPVKRFFIIITKSMYSPADLKEFNDKNEGKDISRLEPCSSLEEVVKDVAGVKNRVYKSSVYKIRRAGAGAGARPVALAAECATPLYTLHKAARNKRVYDDLIDVNVGDVVSDFVSTMRLILAKIPHLTDTCELVYFDDTDKNLNLADILLNRIKELEPNFEQLISANN